MQHTLPTDSQAATKQDGEQAQAAASTAAPAPASERRSPYYEMRRYISIGGMFGNIMFLLIGGAVGFYYGGMGGTRFFSELFIIKETGSAAAVTGSIVGVAMGLICVWAILVITFACCGAILYWIKFKRIPPPPPS